MDYNTIIMYNGLLMAWLSSSRKHLAGVPGLTPRAEGYSYPWSSGDRNKQTPKPGLVEGLSGGCGGGITLERCSQLACLRDSADGLRRGGGMVG